MAQIFDLGTRYRTEGGDLTATLYLLSEKDPLAGYGPSQRRDRQVHETLKHMNPILYDQYGRTVKPREWGFAAWVTLFQGDLAVACYSVDTPANTPAYGEARGGYEVRNEAVLKRFRGQHIGSLALFPSIVDAVARLEAVRAQEGLPARGRTVTVAVDAGMPSTFPSIQFLEQLCGFRIVPPHWKGTFLGEYSPRTHDFLRTFCFAASHAEIPPDAINVAFVHGSSSKSEILLYRRV
jgi:hypothetical protein